MIKELKTLELKKPKIQLRNFGSVFKTNKIKLTQLSN